MNLNSQVNSYQKSYDLTILMLNSKHFELG